ncbi:hypothetical protein [Methanobrevibacter gottschalkii]|nr:hypothetical protein [Methanobrevibacter gottschalkii]
MIAIISISAISAEDSQNVAINSDSEDLDSDILSDSNNDTNAENDNNDTETNSTDDEEGTDDIDDNDEDDIDDDADEGVSYENMTNYTDSLDSAHQKTSNVKSDSDTLNASEKTMHQTGNPLLLLLAVFMMVIPTIFKYKK